MGKSHAVVSDGSAVTMCGIRRRRGVSSAWVAGRPGVRPAPDRLRQITCRRCNESLVKRGATE